MSRPQPPAHDKKSHKVQIEIPLRSHRGAPKRLYCSGQAPPVITLAPPRDTTAFIISKHVLAGRLYYDIGWTDLPSARVAVLASKVLDYVSPRELEDWEYNDFVRREEEKKRSQLEAAVTTKQKKKPGRPRKVPLASEPGTGAEVADGGERVIPDSESEILPAGSQHAGGPSLSTPSKRRLEELLRETDAEETGNESDSAAVARQLEFESDGVGYPSEVQYEGEMDVDSEPVDLLEPGTAELSSRASSLAASPLRAPFSQPSPALPTSQRPGSASSSSVAFSLTRSSLHDTQERPHTPVLAQGSISQTTGKAPAAAAPANPASTPRPQAKPRSRTSTGANTPLVSPYFPTSSTNGAQPPLRRESTGFTPVITLIPAPIRTSSSSNQPTLPPAHPSTPTTTSSKPAHPRTPSSQKHSPRKRKKTPAAPVEAEEWKVKRLEGDKYDYDASGKLVRYFKVLWEGDWPPSQNPSWEPEENISDDLKQEYLRKKESKMKNGYLTSGKSPAKSSPAGKDGGGKNRLLPSAFLPKKRYSSVAEAFEGGMDEVGRQEGGEDEDEGEETFVVTDEPQNRMSSTPGGSFGAFDQRLAGYRTTFGRGG